MFGALPHTFPPLLVQAANATRDKIAAYETPTLSLWIFSAGDKLTHLLSTITTTTKTWTLMHPLEHQGIRHLLSLCGVARTPQIPIFAANIHIVQSKQKRFRKQKQSSGQAKNDIFSYCMCTSVRLEKADNGGAEHNPFNLESPLCSLLHLQTR